MDIILIILLIAGVLLILISLPFVLKKKQRITKEFPAQYRQILEEHVVFYNELAIDRRHVFEQRMLNFLDHVTISGVQTDVEDIDRVFVAASAIIPIFGFENWEYTNIREVLLYPDSFNEEFQLKGKDRNTLGMVGNGPYQQVMMLSRHDLHQGFLNKTGKANTAIHEFVHLLDKTDGSIDGVPEFLLKKQFVLPWLDLMHKEIKQIMSNRSDINPYGATNNAEFLAVVAEYFFERPDLLESKHPELYAMLSSMFSQDLSASRKAL